MSELPRAKIRVTGVVRRSAGANSTGESWTSTQRGSTASATAVASAARLVNPQVGNQNPTISATSSSTSLATREPSPSPEKGSPQEIRKRPISAQNHVVVTKLKDHRASKDAAMSEDPKDGSDPNPTDPKDDVQELRSENERLKTELSKGKGLTDEVHVLRSENEQLKTELSKAGVLQSENEQLKSELSKDELQALRSENERLKTELSKGKGLTDEVHVLRSENERLKTELSKGKGLTDEVHVLRSENEQLKTELSKASEEKRLLLAEKMVLETEKAALEHRPPGTPKAWDALESEDIQVDHQEVEALHSEIEQLKMELSKASEDNRLLLAEKRVLETEKKALERRQQTSLQSLSGSRSPGSAWQDSPEASRDKVSMEKDLLEQRCRALENQLTSDTRAYEETLAQEAAERKRMVEERKILTARCQNVEKQLVAQRRNYVILEKQLTADTKIYEEKLEHERSENKRLQEEKVSLNTRLQTLEKQLARRESKESSEARKVGWIEGQGIVAVPENIRPNTANSLQTLGTLVTSNLSFESADSHASLIYCSSANSLRSVAEWVFPMQNRILPPEKTYDRQLLAPSDPRRQWLEEYIMGSLMSHRKAYGCEEWCSAPQIEIIRVSEVFNPIVNNAFYLQLSQMSEVWGSERATVPELNRAIPIRTAWDQCRMNEVLLFHGCKWDSLFGILREGFDPRLGGINTGAAFGIGCYFTTVASKADAYTERWDEWEERPNCDIPAGMRCLVVARVALGEVFEMFQADSSLRRPPVGTGEMRCDSVLGVPRSRGGCVDYDEFVIFKQAQATPQFIVDYKHTESCTCRACTIGGA